MPATTRPFLPRLVPALLAVAVLVPAGAGAGPTDVACDAILPPDPPTVVDATSPSLSWDLPTDDPTVQDLSLHITSPSDEHVNGQISSSGVASFDLSGEGLPTDEVITYEVFPAIGTEDTTVNGQGCPLEGIRYLAFVISSLDPEDVPTLALEEQAVFAEAAATVFSYAVERSLAEHQTGDGEETIPPTPLPPTTNAEVLDFCDATFPDPTPCDWAPGPDTTYLVPDPDPEAGEEAVLRVLQIGEGVGAEDLCKTIRLSGTENDSGGADFWWRGRWDEDQDTSDFTVVSKDQDKGPTTNRNRFNMFVWEVSGGYPLGPRFAWTEGAAGFQFKLDADAAGGSAALQATLGWEVHGAWNARTTLFDAPMAQLTLTFESQLGSDDDDITATPGPRFPEPPGTTSGEPNSEAGDPIDEDRDGNPPAVVASHGQNVRFDVKGRADVWWTTTGPPARAELQFDENGQAPEYWVFADYADVTVADPNKGWDKDALEELDPEVDCMDPSPGGGGI